MKSEPHSNPFSIVIAGTGSYLPKKCLTNFDLEKTVQTTDEWIRARTGISQRRIAESTETASGLGILAAQEALKNAQVDPKEIDIVIVPTITPDMIFPSTAALIQARLGMRFVPAFDLEAACSGFLYGLEMANAWLKSNEKSRYALVVGAEKLSCLTDWQDRATCILFGDGAGAVVLKKESAPGYGILANILGANGSDPSIVLVPAGGSLQPATLETVGGRLHYMKMKGRELFKVAVKYMEGAIQEVLNKCSLALKDIDLIVPHQANLRILENLAGRIGLPREKLFINLGHVANTSAASIPIALSEAWSKGKIKSGDYILLVGFGAGLTWGATVIKWL